MSTTNAAGQTITYGSNPGAAGGFGQWPVSVTDPNGQTTSYQYDALGRLTAVIRPGDSASSPTASYTYLNTCTAGTTSPCIELDTTLQMNNGGPTATMKQWYDGWGHLVETQMPGPTGGTTFLSYTIYDNLQQLTTQSLAYGISTPTGYVNPDLTSAPSSATMPWAAYWAA